MYNSCVVIFSAMMFLTGCSYLQKAATPRNFVLERSWARTTASDDYLKARVIHTMQPMLVGDTVIAGNEIDSLSAYNKISGALVWQRRFDGGVTSHGLIYQNQLYIGGGDGFFYALSIATGQTKWSAPIRSEGLGAPAEKDGIIYFLSGAGTVYALNADTGEQQWVYTRQDPSSLTIRGASEPTIDGDKLYIGMSDGTLVALNRKTGSLIWEKYLGQTPKFRDVDSKPVLWKGKLYVSSFDGLLYCLDPADGRVFWTYGSGGVTPVTISGDKVYFSSTNKEVVALDLESGKELWKNQLQSSIATQPVVYKGLVIFGEWIGAVKMLDAQSGKLVSEYRTGRGVTAKPVVDETLSRVYVMSTDANLYSLKLILKDSSSEWPWEKL
jgi:outer membrane protein assembly factor BamB